MDRKPYYRIAELSFKTGIPKTTLYDAVRNGEVEALRLGAAVYVPEREAKRLMGDGDDKKLESDAIGGGTPTGKKRMKRPARNKSRTG